MARKKVTIKVSKNILKDRNKLEELLKKLGMIPGVKDLKIVNSGIEAKVPKSAIKIINQIEGASIK